GSASVPVIGDEGTTLQHDWSAGDVDAVVCLIQRDGTKLHTCPKVVVSIGWRLCSINYNVIACVGHGTCSIVPTGHRRPVAVVWAASTGWNIHSLCRGKHNNGCHRQRQH